MRSVAILLTGCLLALTTALSASALRPDASAAFDRYVLLTEQRLDSEIARGRQFLWIDGLSDQRRADMRRGLRDGGMIIERMETRDGGKSIEAPDALIHHWLALVFVPGVSVDAAVALMQNYDDHSRVFAP